jgi:hypothetical protein
VKDAYAAETRAYLESVKAGMRAEGRDANPTWGVIHTAEQLLADNERLRGVLDAAVLLVEEGPFSVSEHSEWACCGRRWDFNREDRGHDSKCPYFALKEAIAKVQ